MTNPYLEMAHDERKAHSVLIKRANAHILKTQGKPRTKQNPNLRVPISVVVDGKRRNIVVVLAISKSRDEHPKKPSYKIDLFSAAIHRLATSLSITPEEVLALLACDVSEGVKSLSKTIDSTYQLFRETLPLKHVNGSALFQAIEAK